MTNRMKKIDGYGDKYRVTSDGRVFRRNSAGQLVPVAQSGDPPRVRLYRGQGKMERKYVHVLVREVFSDDTD